MTTEKQKKRFRITDEAPFEALRIIVSILIALVVTFIVLCVVLREILFHSALAMHGRRLSH